MIKDMLREIEKNQFTLPEGTDEYQIVRQVVGVLGETDSELRELGYTVLQNWLLDKNVLTDEQMKELLNQAISKDMLFSGITETESDHVFLRSFSLLLIGLLLIRDNRDGFLDETTFREVMTSLVTYCKQEKDLRGFVEGKGWAHAAAHASDAVDECVRNRYIGLEDCKVLWTGLSELLTNAPHVFNAEEDERIATAVTAMVEPGKVPLLTLCEWLMQIEVSKGNDIQLRYRRINFKHFIRSLTIRLLEKGFHEQKLLELEHRFNPYFNL